MKLLKMIEILKDKKNWQKNERSSGKTHVPTGIYCYSGANFWDKDGNIIYDVGFFAFSIIDFYVRALDRHLNKDETERFDEIYYKWIDSKEDFWYNSLNTGLM